MIPREMSKRSLSVLQSFPAPRPTTNPYLRMLADELTTMPGLELHYFSWRQALFGPVDVYHVHWPEILLHGTTAVKQLTKQGLFILFLIRLSITRTPIVRTVHNLHRPEGIGRIANLLLTWTDRLTSLQIKLNPATPPCDGIQSVTILHGHYRRWFGHLNAERTDPGRLGYVGLIRRYKGVERLIQTFRETDDEALRLHIAGSPSTHELATAMAKQAAGDRRISLDLHFLSDQELVTAVTRTQLVVLPYRFMHNSGGALAALSLNRPVLVPDNEVNQRLSQEVGPGWVLLYQGELSASHLTSALAASPPATPAPDLSSREWEPVGRQHLDAYRRAIQIRRDAH